VTDALSALADRLGILPDYLDTAGERRETSPDSRAALLRAMGVDPDRAEDALAALDAEEAGRVVPLWQVIETGAPLVLDALEHRSWRIEFEGGEMREGRGADLGEVPLGIHLLRLEGHDGWLLAAPPRLPEPAPAWGVTLPLYGLRTADRGGIGTYRDLAAAVASLGRAGAAFAGVNPIHAGFPADPTGFSPYAPSSRRRFSTLHIEAGAEPAKGDLIDYDHAVPAQQAALLALWRDRGGGPDFDAWRSGEGEALELFALHQALSEELGPYWPDWPEAFRDPAHPDVAAFARRKADRVEFHAWLQWLAEGQLAEVRQAADEAGMRHGLYLDLAVGTHPAGAETWADRATFAQNVSLGAPPDAFSPDGQTWGLAPLQPRSLARQGFRPLAQILRAQLRYAGLLRIDHILGFERTFWVPTGPDAGTPGAYVRMPKEALLAVVRIEAARTGATVIGEDLGNIPEGLGRDLEESGILGCRVAMFEQNWDAAETEFKPAADYDRAALTSFGTHDLPTFAGWRAGRDIDWREKLGSVAGQAAEEMRRQRAAERGALAELAGGPDMQQMHALLADTPSRLVAVQIEDILGLVEQPNLPGTVHEHPNWRRRLPVEPAKLGEQDAMQKTADRMRDAGR